MTRSVSVPLFTDWNVSAVLPLIKIIKYTIEYFVRPTHQGQCLWGQSVAFQGAQVLFSKLPLERGTCSGFPGTSQLRCSRLADMCQWDHSGKRSHDAPWRVPFKLYIGSKTQSKLVMEEGPEKLLSIMLSPALLLPQWTATLTFGTRSPLLNLSLAVCKRRFIV